MTAKATPMFSSLTRRKAKPAAGHSDKTADYNKPLALTDLELVMLAGAAADEAGHVTAPPGADIQRAKDALDALKHLGLAETTGDAGEDQPFAGGHNAGEQVCRITPAGLAAIGLGPEDATGPETDAGEEPLSGIWSASVAGHGNLRAGEYSLSTFVPSGEQDTPYEAGTEDKAKAHVQESGSHNPVRPRLQSKIDALVLARISMADGASIGELVTETGWQAHSLRAVLSGLRARGHTIRRSKDAAGRGTVYRIGSAGTSVDAGAEGGK